MTVERFTDVWCSETGHIGLTDNGVDKEFTGSEFEEWLNNLHEEKEQQQKSFDGLAHNWKIMYDEAKQVISDLENENKQLKHKLQQQELEYAETCHRLKEENEKLEALWEDKCIKKYMGIVGEYALQEMHDEKYGDKE